MMRGSLKKKKRRRKKGGVRLLEHVRLLGRIRYVYMLCTGPFKLLRNTVVSVRGVGGGVRFSVTNRYEGVRFSVITITWEWVGV